MVYLDNAATTFPKPPGVVAAMKKAVTDYGANPGRAGHALSMRTAEAVFESRDKCAAFFGAETENTIFTLNCTFALNIAIKGVSQAGAHYIISDVEHNAVVRPVHAVSKLNGITYSVAKTYDDDNETLKSFESLINTKTKAVVCTAASNVTGKILPFKQIAELCRKRGLCFILDAAQGSGVLEIKLGDGINFICSSGHKSLYGPMGTGLLVSDGRFRLKYFAEGGTGSNSRSLEQPDDLPDRFEVGTVNTPGVIALGAGVDFINKTGISVIRKHELELCELFIKQCGKLNKLSLYSHNLDGRTPLVPFNIDGIESTEAVNLLSKAGFYMRGGLHCSFLAHKKLNTLEHGAVRFSPSVFNTRKEVSALIKALEKITGGTQT
jgi:cysteine desulfurase family protein